MPNLAQLYFRTAILFLIAGVCIGIYMSMSQNHAVVGAHAHVNLLGWVTSALFGTYLALNPARPPAFCRASSTSSMCSASS